MLYILTPVFCVALCAGAVFSFSNNNKVTANAATGTASILDLEGSGKFKAALTGAQNEYIYFGSNDGTPVKWRVLSTGSDNQYSKGNMLLWADYQLCAMAYNISQLNPEYAFWGTSTIRANLNGGKHLTSVGATATPAFESQEVDSSSSLYGKIFDDDVEKPMVVSGNIITDNAGMLNSGSKPTYRFPITESGDSKNGKYNTDRLNKTTHPSSFYADVTDQGGVRETTSDALFLLDYDDMNNTDYGFGDSGLTYASNLKGSSWSKTDSRYYTSLEATSKVSSYLSFSGEIKEWYWLRNSVRYNSSTSTAWANAFAVNKSGQITIANNNNTYGVRPAFNFNADNVLYATSASFGADGSLTAANVSADIKPAYKLYLTKGSLTNSGKANIREENNNLYLTYNNPIGRSDGKLLLVLTNKTTKSVEYQATITMDSKATATQQVATSIALPSGVSLSTHEATLLYTTNNGGNSTESVYCSYNLDSGIDAPQNITVTYDGNSKWITDLTASEKPAWLDLDIYNSTNYVKVDSVEYRAKTTDSFAPSSETAVKNAGEYKVTMSLADGLKWAGSSETQKSFTITINKKPSTPKPKVDPPQTGIPFVTDGLPNLIADTGSTAGTFKWKDGESAKEGTNSYEWIFTPTDPNFTVESGSMELEFQERKITGLTVESYTPTAPVYTNTSLTTIKGYFKIKATYSDGNSDVLPSTGFKLQVKAADKKLVKGKNTLIISTSDDKFPIQHEIDVLAIEVQSISLVLMDKTQFTYPVTADEIKAEISSVTVVWNTGDSGPLDDLSILTVSGTLNAGSSVTITIGVDGLTIPDYTENISIAKGTLTPTVTFANDTVTYDGSVHKIEASVSGLPDGVTLTPAYTVTGSATAYDAAGYTNAGTYNYSVTFTHTNPNYEQYAATSSAILTIEQAEVDMSGVSFVGAQKYANGDSYTLEITGDLPTTPAVSVSYTVEGQPAGTLSFNAEGTYKFTAKFTHSDPNYEQIADMTATLEITKKVPHDMSNVTASGGDKVTGDITNGFTATYDGGEFEIAIDTTTLPASVAVDAVVYEKKQADGSWVAVVGKPSGAGEYRAVVSFTNSDPAYATPQDMEILLTVDKADYDMSGVTFEDKTVTYNGAEYTFEIGGVALPEWITVSYSVEGQSGTVFTDSGVYTFVAKFTHANANYNDIADMTATLTISDAVVSGVSVKVEDGAKFDANSTLDDLKAKLSVEIEYNNGTKETVKVEDLTVTCDTLRDGGKFEVGTQTITIKYTAEDGTEHATTVTVTVAKAKVALPVYKGTLSYTGLKLKPTANDFDGYDADIMSFVESKTVAGLNAGAYKAVFALKDSDRYEWATATTLKKSVFAAAVFDGETQITIDPTFEAAVDWNIAKAKISAIAGADGKPVFRSDGVSAAALAQAVGLKYYADEACTQEVSADELAYETTYYLQAELLDKANFEFDTTVAEVVGVPYTTPAKELTFWEKVVKFLTSTQMGLVVWAWIVIAVVALVLLITIIALAARSAKKKRIREERRLAEEKAEKLAREEREREERRLEREERMVRMNQQAAMPQMMMPQMQMPQPQPQYAPQSQGSASGGGSVSEAQFMQMQAEIATLKAEATLRAEAAMRAEQQIAQTKNDLQFASIMARLGGEQVVQSGVTLDKLTELIRTEVKNAMAEEKASAQQTATAMPENGAANTAPVATQVPPDAVMTTVTTTKIDTTKKPAQNAQGNAQATARPIVRNYVAPMPVDDGRVFDVGGFYKPADPLTDFNFDEEEKKD